MTWPQVTDRSLVWMECQSEKHLYGGSGSPKWVPFLDAIHNPPTCHGLPMLTEGGRRMRNLANRWREVGPVLECRFSSKGEGQGVSCYSHGWGGVYHDLEWDDQGNEIACPVFPVAAWLMRRQELAA